LSLDVLRERSRRDGPRRALVDAGAGFWISWFDLDGLATAWARRLERLGLEPGHRVAVREPAGARFAALLFACLRQGYAFVPLPLQAPPAEVDRVLADCGPRVLVEDGEPALQDDFAPGVEGDACIVYTSGTTGSPRGVRLTAANLVASAEGCQESLASTPEDRWLLCLAPHHVGGLAIFVRAAVSNQPITIVPRFEEARVLEGLARERCSLISLVPTMLVRLLDSGGLEALTQVRAILLGGAPAPADSVRTWARLGLNVCPTYGLTETGSQVATVPPGAAEALAGTAGFPHSRATVEVESGEIVVGGPVLAAGYTDAAILPRLRTRDGGELRADGALVVTGRLDDAIITGGENVHPLEVEAVLRAHPAVRDAAVVGVPDPTWGNVLEARVVAAGVDADDLVAFARERLAPFKVPRRIRFVKTLPRSDGGKLLRGRLV
jgi:O-succinylbenzoic acid--CoA ligase